MNLPSEAKQQIQLSTREEKIFKGISKFSSNAPNSKIQNTIFLISTNFETWQGGINFK
jgi:hypothetical protein